MKIEIDAKKISNSPNLLDQENTLDDETKEIINQLRQQLIYGNDSCFLISGYRGAGKTTLVNILEEEIKRSDNNIMFIHLNFSRYEEYSLMLRKLIREIYMTFLKNENYKEIEKKNKKLIDSIKLLYERTFFEINNTSNKKMLTEFDRKLESSFSIKDILEKFGPTIVVIFASFNISFDVIPNVIKNFNIFLLIGSLIWFIYQSFKLSLYFDEKKTSIAELNIKSLYDNEIAEYHLKDMLKELKKQHIKIVFVFDELDKIEKDDEMEKIVSDFKPILLSGLASFIVISGQKLYYHLTNSNLLDDSIMSSIFSKNMHVPLTTNICLEKLFDSYILNEKNLEIELVKKYRDSLILNSNRTVRRFINIILQDIIWENNKSYLCLEQENIKLYDTDTSLLNIITQITEEEIDDAEYDHGIKDFFIYQLFIWIKKMKLKGKIYFIKDDIFNFEGDYSEIYPFWCKSQLNELCNKLLKSLVQKNLLEEKEEIEDNDKIVKYKWTDRANVKTEGIRDDIDQIKINFLENMIEFEKKCREIYMDLAKDDINNKKVLGPNTLVKNLINIGVLNENWLDSKRKGLYLLDNKLKHGEELTGIEIQKIMANNTYARMLNYYLIEEYCNYVINRHLELRGYKVIRNMKLKSTRAYETEIDIVAANKNQNISDIIFQIKYFRKISNLIGKSAIDKCMKSLMEYNSITQKQNKCILLIFSKEGPEVIERIRARLKDLIDKEYNELGRYMFLYFSFESGYTFNSRGIELYLDNAIDDKLN